MPSCPVCNQEMRKEDADAQSTAYSYEEFACRQDSHFVMSRLVKEELVKIKVRFTEPSGEKLFLKIEYDKGMCEVWGKTSSNDHVVIPHTFTPDFSDLTRLKQKIRTYLVLS